VTSDRFGYFVSPKSRADIDNQANELRRMLSLERKAYFPVLQFAEVAMCYLFGEKYEFLSETKRVLGEIHAETKFESGVYIVRVREDIYLRACDGEGRDRFTIAHELGHIFLGHFESVTMPRARERKIQKAYNDSEWQANAFAGSLLMPRNIIEGKSLEWISEHCGVTLDAARVQSNAYGRQKQAPKVQLGRLLGGR
jgi:Zn-dependent peptidase ImmA (M78 family)